jgi:hypothetical protein
LYKLGKGEEMHIVVGFQSNKFLEMAIEEVQDSGIGKEQIVVIEMKNQEQNKQVFDTILYSDGYSILDGMAAWSVVGSLIGIIWGSRIVIGPIATGLLGFAIGASIGYILDKLFQRKKRKNKKYVNYIDFIIIINCKTQERFKNTTSIFKKYHAVAIGYHTGLPNES